MNYTVWRHPGQHARPVPHDIRCTMLEQIISTDSFFITPIFFLYNLPVQETSVTQLVALADTQVLKNCILFVHRNVVHTMIACLILSVPVRSIVCTTHQFALCSDLIALHFGKVCMLLHTCVYGIKFYFLSLWEFISMHYIGNKRRFQCNSYSL